MQCYSAIASIPFGYYATQNIDIDTLIFKVQLSLWQDCSEKLKLGANDWKTDMWKDLANISPPLKDILTDGQEGSEKHCKKEDKKKVINRWMCNYSLT